MSSKLLKPGPQESAHLHVTGRARYVADDAGPRGTLFVLPVTSSVAHGYIRGIEFAAAAAARSSACNPAGVRSRY